MPEPVTVTLASFGLLLKSFDAFKRSYDSYKLTVSFGTDFEKFQRRFSVLQTKLEKIATTKLVWLQDDVIDEGSEIKIAIMNQLALISSEYGICTDLIQKYHEKGTSWLSFHVKVERFTICRDEIAKRASKIGR
jgi:hypothetical protein